MSSYETQQEQLDRIRDRCVKEGRPEKYHQYLAEERGGERPEMFSRREDGAMYAVTDDPENLELHARLDRAEHELGWIRTQRRLDREGEAAKWARDRCEGDIARFHALLADRLAGVA